MTWVWLLVLVVTAVLLAAAMRRQAWRRGAVERAGRFYCPHCEIEVSPVNPMVANQSGRRIGVHSHPRWCQVCERNAEQHLIHRS
ncbi:MAG: hypothetical protein HYX74_11120 [Acidobacteria bacterium]|nr:hypothetical protein [Acidobacteriota bacterium]